MPARRPTRLAITRLEDRTVPAGTTASFANGVLTARGTAGDDDFTFYQVAGEVYLTDRLIQDGGRQTNYILASRIRRIDVFGGAGNDTVHFRQGPYDGNFNWDDFRLPVYIDGGAGDDNLTGALGDDTIHGGAGNDTIYGVAGVDTIYGGTGNDRIWAESPDFVTYHGNLVYAGPGDDYVRGGDANDTVDGGTGNDTLSGSGGDDALYGGDGNDDLYGSADADTLSGGDGNDYLSGSTGPDSLVGGRGNDYLSGSDGADHLDGGTGRDELYGGSDPDTLVTVVGEDFANPGAGNDRLFVTFDWNAFRDSRGAQGVYPGNGDTASGLDTYELRLRTGRLGADLLNPIVGKVKRVADTFDPLLRFLDRQVPAIPSRITKKTVADFLAEAGYGGAYQTFLGAVRAVRGLPTVPAGGTIDLGRFQVGYNSVYDLDGGNPLAGTALNGLYQKVNALGAESPFLNRHADLLELAFGWDVSLFHYNLPTLSLGTTVSASGSFPSPIWPITLGYSAGVNISLYAQGGFGCDLSGVWAGDPVAGFYADNIAAGLSLGGYFEGSAGVGVANFEILAAGIGGSMSGNVSMSLRGPDGTRVYFRDLARVQDAKVTTGPIEVNLYLFYRYGIPGVWQKEKTYQLGPKLSISL